MLNGLPWRAPAPQFRMGTCSFILSAAWYKFTKEHADKEQDFSPGDQFHCTVRGSADADFVNILKRHVYQTKAENGENMYVYLLDKAINIDKTYLVSVNLAENERKPKTVVGKWNK